uniref:Uncharacterized protein n=2 Tax=viral metagenome TaxID=1070528 RepID=A0A6M3XT90_9ZZZZ
MAICKNRKFKDKNGKIKDNIMETPVLSNVKAIKLYFESGRYGFKVKLNEIKVLSSKERDWFGEQCRVILKK